jgi:hypothetical protein
MIINKTTQDIIRVLLNEGNKKLKLRELASKAQVSLGMTVRIVNALEATGHIENKRGISIVSWEKLLKSWSYTVSIKEYDSVQFIAPERPQYLIKKIGQMLSKETYAFTLFSATEVVSPYVTPDKVHLYILKDNADKILQYFPKEGIMPAEQGNVVCYIVDSTQFYGCQNIRGLFIISLPQLYIDLVSYGGRGEEAAEHILALMSENHV